MDYIIYNIHCTALKMWSIHEKAIERERKNKRKPKKNTEIFFVGFYGCLFYFKGLSAFIFNVCIFLFSELAYKKKNARVTWNETHALLKNLCNFFFLGFHRHLIAFIIETRPLESIAEQLLLPSICIRQSTPKRKKKRWTFRISSNWQ